MRNTHAIRPKRRNRVRVAAPDSSPHDAARQMRARLLDMLADAELAHGHVSAAERLAHIAAELRAVQS